MRIQHNMWALNANGYIKVNTDKSSKTTQKLSSGYRINRSADDAAGLAISEKMRRQIRGLTQASNNCQDGISMVQTAEGALHEVHAMLQRMNELAVQSANGTNNTEDREALQEEFEHIQGEIDRVSQSTTFNEMRLFVGGDSSAGTTNAGGTNGGNIPTVTSLDETQQQVPVMQPMSLRSATSASETSITVGDFMLTGTDLVKGTDYSYSNNVLTILSGKNIIITGTGAATTDRIVIKNNITANVTISNVNISATSASALTVSNNASLNLTLSGTNVLKGGQFYAGLGVNGTGTLVIEEHSSGGSLDATGGQYSAGIGGNAGSDYKSGTIIINSGTVRAKGGQHAAGIGTGSGSSSDINQVAGKIVINGGTVIANGNQHGAGIGGGAYVKGGGIEITGGVVTATSSGSGAGIGGGEGRTGGSIKITGGELIQASSKDGAGIGGGYNGSGGNIEISGGTIQVNSSNGVAIGAGRNGSGGTFTTSNAGNGAKITASVGGNTSLAIDRLITDTSGIDNWEVEINDIVYTQSGDIDLSDLNEDLEINSTGYKIGTKEYRYSGDYTLTGTTTRDINISSDANINMNDTTGGAFNVTGNATVNVNLNGTNTMDSINVETGSILNTAGSGSLNKAGDGANNGGATTGEAKNIWWIQAGSEAGHGLNIQIGAMNTKVLGIEKDVINILTQQSSTDAITAISGAIEKLSEQRSRLGAYQNRLEHTITNLDNVVENTIAAESRIRDADMAKLMVEHTNNNIILQAAQSMLAQANHQTDGVLQLLQ